MNIALKLFFLFLLSTLLGVAAGYVVMLMPCEWFGFSFEGACGYGALWVTIGVAVAVLILSYGSLAYLTVRSLPAPSKDAGDALPKSLLWTWIASLALYLGYPLFAYSGLADPRASLLPVVFFLSTSMVVAQWKGKNPMLAFVTLIPIVGVIAVAFLLFAKREQTSEEGN